MRKLRATFFLTMVASAAVLVIAACDDTSDRSPSATASEVRGDRDGDDDDDDSDHEHWKKDAGQKDAGQKDAGQKDAGQKDAGQKDGGQPPKHDAGDGGKAW